MRIGFVSNNHKKLYIAKALEAHGHEVITYAPSVNDLEVSPVSSLLASTFDFVFFDDLGKHTASLATELEDRKVKMFNAGSVHAFLQEQPDYLHTLGHRVGVPIGGTSQTHNTMNLCVLGGRKGVCGPAFLVESWDRLGPVRSPHNVLCSAVPVSTESKLYKEVCLKVGKIFSSFHCSGVASMEIEVTQDTININKLTLQPPYGFWPLWFELYKGKDPAEVFKGLATGEKFSYAVEDDKLAVAALLTVPPFPISALSVDYSVGLAFSSFFKDAVYPNIGKLYCVESIQKGEDLIGKGDILGWRVVVEEEIDALACLRLEAERLDPLFVQTPTEFPGYNMAYTRAYLEKQGLL